MRKILSLLIIAYLIGFLVSPCIAVTNTATKAGNWSDTTVWDQGHVPEAGEDVALGGYVITWNVATVPIIPATGSLGTITSTGTVTGNATGGTGAASCGVMAEGVGNITFTDGSMLSGTGGMGWCGKYPTSYFQSGTVKTGTYSAGGGGAWAY